MTNMAQDGRPDSPIIGVLCVDIASKLSAYHGTQYTSYMAASYVKFIEGAGARVVPIWIGKSRDYYEMMLSHVNGILLPGGAVFFYEKNGFADAGIFIYEIATSLNNRGIYMPIFGICLGFELILYAAAQTELRQDCHSVGVSYALKFREGAEHSRLFGPASAEIMNIFATEKITFNYHKYCITENDLKDHNIINNWKILSTNSDSKVNDYISSIEHKKYPFYGVQFHPERNEFEPTSVVVEHSENAINCSRYLANFFVSEARKNKNHFDANDETKYLISNFEPTSTDDCDVPWEECYLFTNNAEYLC